MSNFDGKIAVLQYLDKATNSLEVARGYAQDLGEKDIESRIAEIRTQVKKLMEEIPGDKS